MANNSKITLRAEPAPGQYRPTRQDEESKNQGECFAPFNKRLKSTQNINPRRFPVKLINFSWKSEIFQIWTLISDNAGSCSRSLEKIQSWNLERLNLFLIIEIDLRTIPDESMVLFQKFKDFVIFEDIMLTKIGRFIRA